MFPLRGVPEVVHGQVGEGRWGLDREELGCRGPARRRDDFGEASEVGGGDNRYNSLMTFSAASNEQGVAAKRSNP